MQETPSKARRIGMVMRRRPLRLMGSWCGILCLSICHLTKSAPLNRQHEAHQRDEARRLVKGLNDYLGGRAGSEALQEIFSFLSADSNDSATPERRIHRLDVKNGGRRRLFAFEAGALQALTDILSMSGEAQIATTAARCMVMLSAANIKAREEAIGAGTIRILLKLAAYQEDGVDWSDAQAAAAEAVFSLIYSSKKNHEEAVRRGAVTTMLNLARTSVNEWTRMWSMACLYNLAEDYCGSTTGACPWVQVSFAARGVEPDRRGQSDHNARLVIDASAARLSMHAQGAIGLAVALAAKGPAAYCPTNLTQAESKLRMLVREEQSLAAWAAAAVLKSFAFTPLLHGELVKGGAIRVLAKLRTSQCAIEADIADLGLKRLMSVASTRAAFSEEDLAAIEVSARALKNTTQAHTSVFSAMNPPRLSDSSDGKEL